MKFPSIIKTARYQRFHIEPRYYDPVKEEIEEREARIKSMMGTNSGDNGENPKYSSSIQGSFYTKRRSKGGSASFMQLIIMLLLTGFIFGYIFLGNIALYIMVGISSVLLYLKVKRIL